MPASDGRARVESAENLDHDGRAQAPVQDPNPSTSLSTREHEQLHPQAPGGPSRDSRRSTSLPVRSRTPVWRSSRRSASWRRLGIGRRPTDGCRSRGAWPGSAALRYLFLRGPLPANAIAYLEAPPSLRTLCVDAKPFGDAGTEAVSRLTQLENLGMHWAEDITDRGVAYLSRCCRT